MRLYDLQADGALFEGCRRCGASAVGRFFDGRSREIHPSALPEARCALYVCFSWSIQRHGVGAIYPRRRWSGCFRPKIILSEGFREFRRTTVAVPCSKSVAQRAVLAAALAAGESRLANYAPCNDIVGAVEVIRGMGCRIASDGTTLHIEGVRSGALGTLLEDRNRRIGAAHAATDSAGIPYFRFERRCPGGNFRAWQYSEARICTRRSPRCAKPACIVLLVRRGIFRFG